MNPTTSIMITLPVIFLLVGMPWLFYGRARGVRFLSWLFKFELVRVLAMVLIGVGVMGLLGVSVLR